MSSTTIRTHRSARRHEPSSSATATRRRSTGSPRDRRYAEKLATPDITIADLIGEVDPIKVAEGRYLSDELTLHYGLIPRANRGIVAINELPDLAERIQVGLLNILEERDVQIRGFVVRLPLDLYVVASANPEDYTSRGRIITPLKDRLGSQIRTHYPRTLEHEMAIVRQEKHRFEAEEGTPTVVVPAFMEELVAELTHLARRSPEISQRSGVSVRVSVANAEVLEAAALKRAVRLGEPVGAPRVSDLGAVVASTVGKVELETAGDESPEERIVERLITKALHTTFNRRVSIDELEGVVEAFEDGFTVETGDSTPSREYVAWMREVPGLSASVRPAGRVRRHRRRRGARGRRLRRRVPARGSPPRPAAQQGSHPGRDGLPPVTAYSPDPRDLGPEGPASRGRARPARCGRLRAAATESAADALARAARYSAWDGSQQLADLEADEILDALADDIMAEGDLAEALRRLMERGWRTGDPTRGDMAGLRDLIDRLERRREEMLERYQLDDVLGDIRRELDEIVDEEHAGVERRLDEASSADAEGATEDLRSMLRDVAARRLDQLDALPADVGERIRGLQDYDFLEPHARERFDELVKKLQGQVLDQFVAGHVRGDQVDAPGGPRRQPRDGPRPQRADPRADRRRRAGRDRVPGQARPVLPGRPDLRRHHRPAGPADGRHAVAACAR